MKYKKYPNKDLNQKRSVFFALGLVLILGIIYLVLEWKMPEDNAGFDIGSDKDVEIQQKDSSVILETKATKKPSTQG